MSSAKIATVRARVSSQLKAESEQVLSQLGMNVSDAIRIFLTQVALRKEFPVELKIPNMQTLEAMKEAPEAQSYQSASALFIEAMEDEVKEDHVTDKSDQDL